MPAFWNVNANCPPGATDPEFHPLPSDVDVCATESRFVHVIVVPAWMSATSGLNAVVVSVDAPAGIETDDEEPE